MDLLQAISARQSIRAFKPDPVPKEVLKEIMERAIWAPSWGNTQPWDFFIATGSKLVEIQSGFADRVGRLQFWRWPVRKGSRKSTLAAVARFPCRHHKIGMST